MKSIVIMNSFMRRQTYAPERRRVSFSRARYVAPLVFVRRRNYVKRHEEEEEEREKTGLK